MDSSDSAHFNPPSIMPVQFDPKIHLAYSPPESCITMEELGQAGKGLSSVGVTQPFPLLSEEGVRAIREELFTPHILDRCTYYVTDLLGQLRGMSSRPGFAPFNEAFWTHPETNRIVSEAAGVELVPIMPYELGHINVQLNSGKETFAKLGREPLRGEAPDSKRQEAASAVPKPPEPKVDPDVMEWHRDSYPWVCIVMLSDATTMQGGETLIGCTDGTMQKVRGPGMGWAMVLQGGYVDHAALGAYGGQERITMASPSWFPWPIQSNVSPQVTSYRAKDVMLPDISILSPLRPAGHHNEMYYEWSTYRLDLLSERFKLQSEAFKKKRGDGQGPWGEEVVKKDEFKEWCKEQIKYLQTTIDGID